eukprot:CAMPEP_0183731262 /NCGR_PEP_ID=MMETSP0737-20130205/34888_1 /TAXON_ID=385413 /ORGANISM="Thalassiosira miniscula, Strain CCMP1093" /LENGTH=198 /DNA_ID=CAMNT_0025963953 /DNA_START=8 /DNA_END=604 /DNA_ORIENTATION=-
MSIHRLERAAQLLLLLFIIEVHVLTSAFQPIAPTLAPQPSARAAGFGFGSISSMHNAEGRKSYSPLHGQNQGGDSSEEESSILDTVGLVSQPIVWVSLYSVVTTGAGLPSGPFGLLGAVEGLSYLLVLGFALASFGRISSIKLKLVESLSWLTLGAGLLSLGALVAQQGCVPNAKPILDYSSYLPVCNPEQTPGLFGG